MARWWREWRAVAALFALAFGLQLAATYIDYRKLEGENLSLRSAVESSYRKAYPKGAIVDAETQLRRAEKASRTSPGAISQEEIDLKANRAFNSVFGVFCVGVITD